MKYLFFFLQGGHIKINLRSEIPVQVDGEPWVAAPSEVVVLKSALKVGTYLQIARMEREWSKEMRTRQCFVADFVM